MEPQSPIKKADERADKDRGQDGFGSLAVRRESQRQRERADGGDARGEAVHIVEQVYGIGDPDQPKSGDRLIEEFQPRDRKLEVHADDDGGAHHLPEELLIGLDVEDVVEEPDEEKQRAGAYDDQRFARLRDRQAVHNDRGEKDRKASEHGRWPLMPAVAFWLGNIAVAPGNAAHNIGQRNGEQEARNSSDQRI
jgi:hypothetical protein